MADLTDSEYLSEASRMHLQAHKKLDLPLFRHTSFGPNILFLAPHSPGGLHSQVAFSSLEGHPASSLWETTCSEPLMAFHGRRKTCSRADFAFVTPAWEDLASLMS